MDRIAFVVAEDSLGGGTTECAEPVINGESLPDILKRLERRPIAYAGLPPDELAAALAPRDAMIDAQVLRCICGDRGCAWARVLVERRPREVHWHSVRTSWTHPAAYAGIGLWRFSARAYDQALADPTRAAAPARDRTALIRLARGEPRNHRRWLAGLHAELGADAFGPGSVATARAGLRAFAATGDPMPDDLAARWAREAGLSGRSVREVVSAVRASRTNGGRDGAAG